MAKTHKNPVEIKGDTKIQNYTDIFDILGQRMYSAKHPLFVICLMREIGKNKFHEYEFISSCTRPGSKKFIPSSRSPHYTKPPEEIELPEEFPEEEIKLPEIQGIKIDPAKLDYQINEITDLGCFAPTNMDDFMAIYTASIKNLSYRAKIFQIQEFDLSEIGAKLKKEEINSILKSLPEIMPNLETINLSNCINIDGNTSTICFQKLLKLTNLDLSGCNNISFEFVYEAVTASENLESITLTGCNSQEITTERLQNLLTKQPNIVIIDCNGDILGLEKHPNSNGQEQAMKELQHEKSFTNLSAIEKFVSSMSRAQEPRGFCNYI